jgi:hypothetical protein
MRRVMDATGNHMYIRRWVKNRKNQTFIFDEVSKTIRLNGWKNYCLEIQGSGTQKVLRYTTGINSRWW